jgi:hypothetical protein
MKSVGHSFRQKLQKGQEAAADEFCGKDPGGGAMLERNRYVVVELVVSVEADLARVLQPVERRLARELSARLVQHGGESRIVRSSS